MSWKNLANTEYWLQSIKFVNLLAKPARELWFYREAVQKYSIIILPFLDWNLKRRFISGQRGEREGSYKDDEDSHRKAQKSTGIKRKAAQGIH